MSEGGCGDPGAVQGMASELFDLASLLVGDEQRALASIEAALAAMEIDPCLNPEGARVQARLQVARTALGELAVEQPGALVAAPELAGGCVQDEDLEAAGITQEQLRAWLGDQGKPQLRRELRTWIEGLPLAQRAVFVQRAVLGQSNDEAAALLQEATDGRAAGGWTSRDVGLTFRQALCSLANRLAHAPTADALPA